MEFDGKKIMQEYNESTNYGKTNKEEYLAKLSPEMQSITLGLLERKRTRKENVELVNDLQELTRQVLDSDVVVFEDDSSLSLKEMYVPAIIHKVLKSDGADLKTLLDLQKLEQNKDDNNNTFKVEFITNGQDLGE